jgi:hypothetical protein
MLKAFAEEVVHASSVHGDPRQLRTSGAGAKKTKRVRLLCMIKGIALMVLGAVGALEAEKRLSKLRQRFTPRAVTDAVLDKANQKLEQSRRPF